MICKRCQCEAEWRDCPECDEDGFTHHECGEDTCACINKSNNVVCDNCDGATGFWICPKCRKEAKKCLK